MSYRYDSYTDTFVHIPDEQPNTAAGMGYLPQYILQKQVELTNECIEAIADAVVRKLKEAEADKSDVISKDNLLKVLAEIDGRFKSIVEVEE